MVKLMQAVIAMASASSALAASSYSTLEVRNYGVPAGQLKNVNGSEFTFHIVQYSKLTKNSRHVPLLSTKQQYF